MNRFVKNLYETHLQVRDLQASISFYQKLGLQLSYVIPERKVAFFYIGEDRQLLGLWEVPGESEVQCRHFAFGTELERLLNAIEWLTERGIRPIDAFGKEPLEPVVHTWMPAASVYFLDPDGNELELIAWLQEEPLPELGYTPYFNEWKEIVNKRAVERSSL